ncbi:unnamed protein product, partial [Amoebophrya sp. A25]
YIVGLASVNPEAAGSLDHWVHLHVPPLGKLIAVATRSQNRSVEERRKCLLPALEAEVGRAVADVDGLMEMMRDAKSIFKRTGSGTILRQS